MAADTFFGTNTNRHNFKLGDDQVNSLYLGDDRVWVNETTVSFNTPTGYGTWSAIPDIVGVPGSNVNVTSTLTLTDSKYFTGTGSVSETLPGDLVATLTYNANQYNTQATIRITGTQPGNSSSGHSLVASGLTINTPVTFNYALGDGGSAATGSEHAGSCFDDGSWGSWRVNATITGWSGTGTGTFTIGTGTNSFSWTGGSLGDPSSKTFTASGNTSSSLTGSWYWTPGTNICLTGNDSFGYLSAPFGFIGTNITPSTTDTRTFDFT